MARDISEGSTQATRVAEGSARARRVGRDTHSESSLIGDIYSSPTRGGSKDVDVNEKRG
jgi:hypothetical protein